MTRQELKLKAKEFDSKLKRHPMSSDELQNVLCDFVEALRQPPVIKSVCVNCKQHFTDEEIKTGHCFNCGEQDL